MKKVLLFFVLGALLVSCSDKLTTSKAEKLIEEKLKEKPVEKYVTLNTGDSVAFYVSNGDKAEIEAYESLQKEGFIKMALIDQYESYYPNSMNYIYSIHLTDKGKQYLLRIEDVGKYKQHIMKTYSASLDKVDELHVIPEQNSARALVFFKIEKTPFFVLENLKTQERIKENLVKRALSFRKLEEKGWKVEDISDYDIEEY